MFKCVDVKYGFIYFPPYLFVAFTLAYIERFVYVSN